MEKRRMYWENYTSAWCAVHRMIEMGEIVIGMGKEVVDGVERYWADVMR